MNFDYAALERRIAALESAQTASLRFGRVTGVKGGKARVEFADGQRMNSFELSTIQKRVLKDQDIEMPDIGEPVACLFSGQGNEQGLVLGAYYNGQESDPGQPSHIDYKRYEDGTELWYDRKKHKLVAKVQGDIEIECKGDLKISVKGKISFEAPDQFSIKAPHITLDGDVRVPSDDVTAGIVTLRHHVHTFSSGPTDGGPPRGG